GHAEPLGRILAHIRALEQPAPYAPPAARQPGDDADGLAELIAGLDAVDPVAHPVAHPVPHPAPRPTPAFEPPRTAQAWYNLACNGKFLPEVNRFGKARGWPRLVTQWSANQVSLAFRELIAAANGRGR